MYNLRYHIASLVAVFLALAIGLLLGTIVVERGVLDKQRTTIVKSLQSDFTGLKKDNVELRRDRDRLHSFAVAAAPEMVDGVLAGKTVLLVTNAGRNDALSITRDAVRAAGADSIVITVRSKDLGLSDAGVETSVTSIASGTPGAGGGEPVVSALAREWTERAQPQPVTDALRTSGEISIESTGTEIAADGVVLLASFDGQASPALVSLVSSMRKQGAAAAGVEAQSSTGGVADAALGAGIPTVDDIDRPEGVVALAYVLAGRAEGHFGVKPSASALFPKLR